MKEMFLITGVFDRLSGRSSSEESGEPEYTVEDYQELLNEYRDAEAEVLINIAIIYFEDENIVKSIRTLEQAIGIYEELGDVGKQALVLDIIGDINRHNKKISTAQENYTEAYELYSSIESDLKDTMIEKIKELDILKAAEEAESRYNYQIPREDTGPETHTSDYNKISKNIENVIGMLKGADTYILYMKAENPMEKLRNAYEMSSGIGDNTGMATLLLIMGDVSLKEGKTEDALKYFNSSLENFQQVDDTMGEAVSRLLIGTSYYITGYMEKVPENFRKSIEILRSLNDVAGENIAMNLMNAIYEE